MSEVAGDLNHHEATEKTSFRDDISVVCSQLLFFPAHSEPLKRHLIGTLPNPEEERDEFIDALTRIGQRWKLAVGNGYINPTPEEMSVMASMFIIDIHQKPQSKEQAFELLKERYDTTEPQQVLEEAFSKFKHALVNHM